MMLFLLIKIMLYGLFDGADGWRRLSLVGGGYVGTANPHVINRHL